MPIMEFQSLQHLPVEDRVNLLRLMGYDSDGKRVLTKEGAIYRDPYTNVEVVLDRMAVLPGSWIVIDYNPLSISGYQFQFEE